MDLFVEQNFLMNLIVLSLTHILCDINGARRCVRRCLAALLGAVCSAGILVIASFFTYVVVTLVVIVPLMIAVAFGKQSIRQWIRRILLSWLSMVIVNGIVSTGCLWTGTTGITWYLAILSILAAHVLVRNLIGNMHRQAQNVKVVLTHCGKEVLCTGLYDSGNRLQMPDSGEPVHIISRELFWGLGLYESEEKSIRYCALGTKDGQIGVSQVERMKVVSGTKAVCYVNPWMGCAQEGLFRSTDYQIILNSAVHLL